MPYPGINKKIFDDLDLAPLRINHGNVKSVALMKEKVRRKKFSSTGDLNPN